MQKINRYKQKVSDFLNRLNDVRFAGQLIFVFIVLLVSWSGIKSIQTNYSLQKQISAIKEQNDLQQLQNDNLNLQNNYYKTNQYLELSARQDLGLAEPGEKEIIVPQNVALEHTINLPSAASQKKSAVSKSPFQKNVQSWADFFFHRST